jgi:hypothetical protein
MATWSWVLGGPPPTGVRLRQLTKARGRTVTWRLDAAATAQFTINGRSDEAAGIVALASDLTLYRDGVKMFRGRIGPELDDISPNRHVSQFTAVDYRAMLEHRQTGAAGVVYPATAAGAIALDLIADSQALSGGDWGITAGVGTTTGTSRIWTIDPGKPVIESINELGRLDNGYEWEIDADLKLNLWHPQRGANNGVVLDFRGLVARVSRQLDPKDFGNSELVTGKDGLTPVSSVTAGIATDPRGRWELSAGFPAIQDQPALNAKGTWVLTQVSTLRPIYRVVLRPGRWRGPSHIWLGDTVTLAIKSGRLNVSTAHRVAEISVQPGEAGTETVALGLLAA